MHRETAREESKSTETKAKAQEASPTICAEAPKADAAPRSASALLLRLQRQRGNRFVQRLLKKTGVQRQCSCGSCSACGSEQQEVQRHTAGEQTPSEAPAVVHEVLRSSGQPLDARARSYMEQRFGVDFGHVRVHTGSKAAESADAVGALAYTVGQNVVFGDGQYAPETEHGRMILAHELAHTIQQGGHLQGSLPNKLEVSDPDDAAEREADTVARRVASGQAPALSPNELAVLARQAPPAAPAPAPAPCANPGNSRAVTVQPVFFKDSATDAAPTGTSWTRRFNMTNTVWNKLGVTFTASAAITKIDALNKTAGSTEAEYHRIRATQTGAGVEVFMVDNPITWAGGGGCVNGGSDAAQIVLSDGGTSDTVLAHELGHALGLGHPPLPGADTNTIMTPSGSNSVANPTRNTMANYNLITWPAAGAATCLTPDA